MKTEIIPALILQGDVVDTDAATIGDIYERSNSVFKAGLREAVELRLECGRCLEKTMSSLPYGARRPWLADNETVLGFGHSTAYRMIKTAKLVVASTRQLDDYDILKLSRQMWGNKGEGNHLAQGTGENEWYTPPEYVEKARAVMGGIDLDPASSAEANETIGANKFYSVEDDGLSQAWFGRVWLNPPYSQPQILDFTQKIVTEFQTGHIEAAIMLTHNGTKIDPGQEILLSALGKCRDSMGRAFVVLAVYGDPISLEISRMVKYHDGQKTELRNANSLFEFRTRLIRFSNMARGYQSCPAAHQR